MAYPNYIRTLGLDFRFITRLGKKHTAQAVQWVPSAVTFGAAGFMGLLYFTDWKLFLQYLPIYNTKYPKEEKE